MTAQELVDRERSAGRPITAKLPGRCSHWPGLIGPRRANVDDDPWPAMWARLSRLGGTRRVVDVQTAWLTPTTDEETATLGTIFASEDGSTVIAGGPTYDDAPSSDSQPVWWVPSEELPSAELLMNSTEHTAWEGGYTWPREVYRPLYTLEPVEAVAQVIADDYRARHEDTTNADEAAYVAVELLIGGDWLAQVPLHWTPGAWLEAYHVCYAEAWRKKLGLVA